MRKVGRSLVIPLHVTDKYLENQEVRNLFEQLQQDKDRDVAYNASVVALRLSQRLMAQSSKSQPASSQSASSQPQDQKTESEQEEQSSSQMDSKVVEEIGQLHIQEESTTNQEKPEEKQEQKPQELGDFTAPALIDSEGSEVNQLS